MEAVVFHSTPDQSISPYNHHIKDLKRNNRPFISRSSENFAPNNFHDGLLFPPPYSLAYSFPVSNHFHQPPQQPPLLPLPISRPYNNNFPVNRKTNNNRTRDQPLLRPKKSKPSTISPKKDVSQNKQAKSVVSSECLIIESTNRFGPDPKDLPKDVSKVLSLSSSSSGNMNNTNNTTLTVSENDQVDKFSGSVVFTISPPPSSLPLPTFSLRPKLSCKTEAAGVDAGATDSLRRLLRLR